MSSWRPQLHKEGLGRKEQALWGWQVDTGSGAGKTNPQGRKSKCKDLCVNNSARVDTHSGQDGSKGADLE